MGFSEKTQLEGATFDSEGNNRKWVIAGIALRAPLKPIYTTRVPVEKDEKEHEDDEIKVETEELSTTPTCVESKIPTPLTCPPAPMKRKAAFKCKYGGAVVVRDFFTPPDLETVFIRHTNSSHARKIRKISFV